MAKMGLAACTVAIASLGCKLNQSKAERLAPRFKGAGHVIPSTGSRTQFLAMDVTVKSPGETDTTFEEAHSCVHRVSPAVNPVFPKCSASWDDSNLPRQSGTPQTRRLREERMLAPTKDLARSCGEQACGNRASVLREERKERDGRQVWSGPTENHIRVFTPSFRNLANKVSRVTLEEAQDGLWCTLDHHRTTARIRLNLSPVGPGTTRNTLRPEEGLKCARKVTP